MSKLVASIYPDVKIVSFAKANKNVQKSEPKLAQGPAICTYPKETRSPTPQSHGQDYVHGVNVF